MMTYSIRTLTFTAVIALVTASGAGGQPLSGKAAKGSDNPDTNQMLTIRVATNPAGYRRFLGAQALGLFEKHGVKVEEKRFATGPETNAAFRAGAVDAGYVAVPGLMANIASGSQVQWFLTDGVDETHGLLTSDPDVKSVQDLKGRKVGTAAGTVAYVGLILALEKAGLDPKKDVEIINIPPNAWVPAFKRHSVDALYAWGPMSLQIEETGARFIARTRDLVQMPVIWMGRQDFLDSKDGREATVRFISAMQEAGDSWPSNKEKITRFAAKVNGVSEEIMSKTFEQIRLIPYEDELDPNSEFSLANPKSEMNVVHEYIRVLTEGGFVRNWPDIAPKDFNTGPLRDFASRKR